MCSSLEVTDFRPCGDERAKSRAALFQSVPTRVISFSFGFARVRSTRSAVSRSNIACRKSRQAAGMKKRLTQRRRGAETRRWRAQTGTRLDRFQTALLRTVYPPTSSHSAKILPGSFGLRLRRAASLRWISTEKLWQTGKHSLPTARRQFAAKTRRKYSMLFVAMVSAPSSNLKTSTDT